MNEIVKQNFSVQTKRVSAKTEICSCGQHEGVGTWLPYERAMAYNWFRRRNKPSGKFQEDYLKSYEIAHGTLAVDEFLFNSYRYKNDEGVQACLNGAPFTR